MKRFATNLITLFLIVGMVVSCLPTMKAAAAKKVALSKKSVTIYTDKKKTIKLKNATASGVKWKTKDDSVASIKKKGASVTITGELAGKTKVIATYKGKKYICKVTVKSVKPTSLKLNKTKATIKYGEKLQLSYSYAPKNITVLQSWKSDNPYVAYVSRDGMVTAYRVGTAKISITLSVFDENSYGTIPVLSDTCEVTVLPTISMDSTASMTIGDYKYLRVSLGGFAYDNNPGIIWSSSDPSVVDVEDTSSSIADLDAKFIGTATITASVPEYNLSATCIVTVGNGTSSDSFNTIKFKSDYLTYSDSSKNTASVDIYGVNSLGKEVAIPYYIKLSVESSHGSAYISGGKLICQADDGYDVSEEVQLTITIKNTLLESDESRTIQKTLTVIPYNVELPNVPSTYIVTTDEGYSLKFSNIELYWTKDDWTSRYLLKIRYDYECIAQPKNWSGEKPSYLFRTELFDVGVGDEPWTGYVAKGSELVKLAYGEKDSGSTLVHVGFYTFKKYRLDIYDINGKKL